MTARVSAKDLLIGDGQRFQPIDGEFGLALQSFHRAQNALRPFRVPRSIVFRATIVRDDFHIG
jgi:hypothetical protein